MSHGDEIKVLPEGFKFNAKSASSSPAGIENPVKKLFALRFVRSDPYRRRKGPIREIFVSDRSMSEKLEHAKCSR